MPLFLLVHVYSLLLFISLFSEWTNERWYLTTETAFSSLQVWQGNWMETRKQKESGPELATHQLNFQFSIKYSLEHDTPCRKKRCDRKNKLYSNSQYFPSHPQKIWFLTIMKTKPNKAFLVCLLPWTLIYSQGQSVSQTKTEWSSDCQVSPFFAVLVIYKIAAGSLPIKTHF